MLVGSQRFGLDLDLWSLGCVAAELFLREPLFQQNGKELNERCFLDAQFAFVGTHPSSTNEWMTSLPFTENFYGRDARRLPAKAPPEWPQNACEYARHSWPISCDKPCSGTTKND